MAADFFILMRLGLFIGCYDLSKNAMQNTVLKMLKIVGHRSFLTW
jgi:hypothetical protein